MTEASDDFFNPVPDGPARDRYGRPLLIPAVVAAGLDLATMRPDEKDALRQPYTRASSLADYIADFYHIQTWKMRYLARSLGQNRDLAALAGAECYTTGFDKGEEKENRASGKRLDEIINRALDRGGIAVKADYGTVVHALTEPGNDGNVEDYGNIEKDVASFWKCINDLGITILGTELFTANDHLMVAGTFDHLMYVPGYGIVITDKKTSSEVHGEDFRIQLASYAGARIYDWETDEWISLEDYIEKQGWPADLLDRTKGLIFWIKNGETKVYELDLTAGLEAAHHAVWVRDHHRKGTHKWMVTSKIAKARLDLEEALERWVMAAPDSATLLALWRQWSKTIWGDRHTAAAKARQEEF